MPKQIIQTDKAPKPIGPYNQAIKTGELLFISGQIAINPKNNELIIGDATAEAKQIMQNLQAILAEAKLSFEHVVKTSIFLTDMSLFGAVNDVYSSYFTNNFPARETVAVKALPKGREHRNKYDCGNQLINICAVLFINNYKQSRYCFSLISSLC